MLPKSPALRNLNHRKRVVNRIVERRCGSCRKWKPEQEGYHRANRGGSHAHCKECMKVKSRVQYAKRKELERE